MVTGYEAGFYRDMTQLKQDLDNNLGGLQGQLEMHSELLLSLERTTLIAAVFATATPKDVDPVVRLQIAANAVDKFLKKEMS
jgi:hypothetical protein